MTNLDVMELLARCPSDYEICADISQDAAINCIVVDDRNGTIYLTDDKEIALIDAQDNDGDDKDRFTYSLEPYSGVKMIVQPAGIQVKHDNFSGPVVASNNVCGETRVADQSAESSKAANSLIKVNIDLNHDIVGSAYAVRRFAAYRSA